MDFSYKKIWHITFPVLMSVLMEHLIGMTDSAFLGRVGEVELGASALAGVYYLGLFMLGLGFSIGAQIIIARRNGEKNYAGIGPVFMQGVLFLMGLATVMFFVSRWVSPLVLEKIIDSRPVYEATMSYLNWRIYGLFFAFTIVMFRAFYVGTTNTKTLTLNSVIMVASNVVMNYLFIFGHFGFPKMGIAGAALASSLAELVSVLFFIFYTWKVKDTSRYGFFRFGEMDIRSLFRILKTSIWTMIQYFIAVSVWFLFFLAIEHLGERPLAVTNIVRNISALPFMITIAFASTGSSLISNLIGEGKSDMVLPLCRRIIKITYMFVLPLVAFIMIFPTLVIRIYTDDHSLVQNSVAALLVMCSAYVIVVPMNVYFNAVSGTGNTRGALFIEFAALVVYSIGIFILAVWLRADVAVCWFGEHIYALSALVFSYLYMTRVNWRRKQI